MSILASLLPADPPERKPWKRPHFICNVCEGNTAGMRCPQCKQPVCATKTRRCRYECLANHAGVELVVES